MINDMFFKRDAMLVAKELIGKVIRKRYGDIILSSMIVETECYYIDDKGSHASLGYTEKRKPLFMEGGTIYMYYARGKDSFNISAKGEGNAVLIKGAMPYTDEISPTETIEIMHKLNPNKDGSRRKTEKLCSGQTLVCTSMGLKLDEWTGKSFIKDQLYLEDVGYTPDEIIQTTRLGIPSGRDEHLPYRFVDKRYAHCATSNPLTKRVKNYSIITL